MYTNSARNLENSSFRVVPAGGKCQPDLIPDSRELLIACGFVFEVKSEIVENQFVLTESYEVEVIENTMASDISLTDG